VSAQTGETVNVSVLDGHEVVYVARSNAPRWVSVGYQVGVRVPAHVVTPGPVILSTWSDAALADWVAAHEFASFTARTVAEPVGFVEEVRRAREQGYWFTAGQLDAVYQGLSLPLIDRKGRCHGAIGMTVIASQYSEEAMLTRLLPPLREAAQALRAVL
jgi:IclR family pca regulon transcriptional regulator